MNQIVTTGMALSRREFGEADRILTMLTPDQGKVLLLAKGVRRPKSKLAGGIELFSVSNITFIKGRGAFSTLLSARLITHYGNIVKDINRTMLGYDLLKMLNKATEDAVGEEYFDFLQQTFIALDNLELDQKIVELWFYAHLLKHSGHTPNLRTDASKSQLQPDSNYFFDFDHMAFTPKQNAEYTAHHIKFLRLTFSVAAPAILQKVEGLDSILDATLTLTKTMLSHHVRI